MFKNGRTFSLPLDQSDSAGWQGHRGLIILFYSSIIFHSPITMPSPPPSQGLFPLVAHYNNILGNTKSFKMFKKNGKDKKDFVLHANL